MTPRHRRSRLLRRRDDEGAMLVLALLVCLLMVGSVAVAASVTTANLSLSVQSGASQQAGLAAQSGLAAAVATMRTATSYSSLPCSASGSLTAPGAASNYTVTVTYLASGSTLSCTGTGSTLGGTTAPTNAALTATGNAARGFPTVMKEDFAIATTTQYQAALGYAIFTENNLNLTNAAVLNPSGTNVPNIYVGQTLTCNNGTTSDGGVTTYYPVSLSNACSFTGALVANGAVTMSNSATVNGALTSYKGGITMSGNAHVAGTATAAGTVATISLANSATVGGNALASSTISTSGGSVITGTRTPNDSALTSLTMPTQVSFPTIDPTVATWQSQGWNVIQPTNCNPLSTSDYFYSWSSGAADQFMTDIADAATKTVIYAPTCAVVFNNAHVFNLNADIALQVKSLMLNNSNIFQSSSATHHDFSILASADLPNTTSTVEVNLNNATTFASSLSTFIYTPGQVDYANDQQMSGQVLAEGGLTGENAFTLAFDPSAAAEVPGSSNPLPPTLVAEDKYVVNGV